MYDDYERERRREQRRQAQRRSNQMGSLFRSFILTILVLIALALLVWLVVIPQFRRLSFVTQGEIVPFSEYFSLPQDTTTVILNNQIMRDAPVPIVETLFGEYQIYMPASFLHSIIDPFLFWDQGAGVFFASTRYEMLEFVPGRFNFTINGAMHTLTSPVRYEDGEIYLPISIVHGLYPILVEYHSEHDILTVTTTAESHTVGTVITDDTVVRFRGESRAPLAARLSAGDEVTVFIDDTPTGASFTRVRTADGIIGYINTGDISHISSRNLLVGRAPLLGSFVDNNAHHPPNWTGGAINLVWDAIHNPDANALRMQTPIHPSVNVISPTWFDFNGPSQRLSTHASRAYVDWAHAQNVYVWPMVFDVNRTYARDILMDVNARRTVINQLIHYVDSLNLDGINIDIEHLRVAEEGPYKIQFLRELAIPMRERGIVLSAAVKVPMEWSMFYRRDLIALTVDFVMLMAYDEHYRTAATMGPVASLPWVQQGVIRTLEEVPRDQLLLGIPLYNRVWREVLSDGTFTPHDWGMDRARNFFEDNAVIWEWDSNAHSYFGEVALIEDGQAVLYRVWLEDPRSIRAKLQVYVVHDLAGVASWRRELETAEIWEILATYVR